MFRKINKHHRQRLSVFVDLYIYAGSLVRPRFALSSAATMYYVMASGKPTNSAVGTRTHDNYQ
jgi:ABC-type polysaccharide transport system permease subunit